MEGAMEAAMEGAAGRRKGEPRCRSPPHRRLADASGEGGGDWRKAEGWGRGGLNASKQRLNPLPCCCRFGYRPTPSPSTPPAPGFPPPGPPGGRRLPKIPPAFKARLSGVSHPNGGKMEGGGGKKVSHGRVKMGLLLCWGRGGVDF